MSAALLPVYFTAAALLVTSAVAKLARPEPAANAMAEIGLPGTAFLVRGAALVELAVAVAMVVTPAIGGPAGAVLYLGFAALLAAQLRRGGVRSCGCLGAADLPPSRAHLALDVVLAAVCAAERAAPLRMLVRHPAGGAVVVASGAAAAWTLVAALELVPPALAAYRRAPSS
ncbi:MAG TPA: MauE/DoxX family redox-associated membrane protein [Gaiellaceae bacterium]